MKFLINRTDAIGDCLLSTPMARLLKDRDPNCEIHFLVSPRSGDLINLCEGVDKALIYDPSWSFSKRFHFLKTLFKEESYTHFFHLGGKHLPIIMAFLLKVSFRGGLKSKWSTFLFLNKGMRQSRRLVTMHESDYNLQLANVLGIHALGKRPPKFAPRLNVTVEENEKVKQEEKLGQSPYIIIHPGMSGHTLNWASRNYGRLIERIHMATNGKYKLIISHTPSDEPYLEGLKDFLAEKKDLQKDIHFYDGSKKGIVHYTRLLKGALLFIGPSTGTTHMANALGVPQIAIFSPIRVQSSHRWGPYLRNDQVKVIVPDVVCGESIACAGSSCPYYECMAKIEVDEVFQAALELLPTKGSE